MKRSPVENRIGKCDHVYVKHNHFLALYSMIVENEIIGYNIYLVSDLNNGCYFVVNEHEITTMEQADTFMDRTTMRIEMKRRGICLN